MLTPYSYDDHTPEEWQEFLSKLHAGEKIAIDESMFSYFLEVLPPIFMNKYVNDLPGYEGHAMKISFGFAEGAEPITYFWRTLDNGFGDGCRYFCQRSKRMNPYA